MRAPLLVPWVATSLALSCHQTPTEAPRSPPPAVIEQDGGGSSILSIARVPASGCPARSPRSALGPGTVHRFEVSGNETWTLEGSPHRVPRGLTVLAGASVTVAPCAVVLVGEGRGFVVADDAALLAVGTADRPIVFAPDVAQARPGDWLGLELRPRARPSTRLAYVTVEHAGAPRPADPLDVPAGVRTAMEPGLDVAHVTVRASLGWGVALTEHAGFAATAGPLTVVGARGPGAVYFADADRVHTLPEGNYTGNASDEVLVAARQREVRTTATWRALGPGARYRIPRGAHVMVQGEGAPGLTLAPGTTVAFDEDAELDVGWDGPGALVADGASRDGTITFTSSRRPAAPASWVGIFLGPHLDVARSRLRFVTIEGAGADSGFGFEVCLPQDPQAVDDGMLMLHRVDAVGVISHVSFLAGPRHGFAILRSGDFQARPADFTQPSLGLDFAASGTRCPQSRPRVRGECPVMRACE